MISYEEFYRRSSQLAIVSCYTGGWRCKFCMVHANDDVNNVGYVPNPFPHHRSCDLYLTPPQ